MLFMKVYNGGFDFMLFGGQAESSRGETSDD